MSLAALSFARPGWFLVLPLLVLLLWRLWQAPAAGRAAWRRAVDAHLLPHLLFDAASQRRQLALLGGALALAVLALAGPRLESRAADAYRPAALRVLVVELSEQMAAAAGDAAGWQGLRLKLLDLLAALPPGQTALVVYAGEPYLVVPPTSDVATIARFVPELDAAVVPVAGNAPERALAMAGRMLARNAGAGRDVLWITAGARPLALPEELAGARLSVLHVGAAADPGLAAAAARSGGVYARMGAADADVRALAAHLAPGRWTAAAGAGDAADLGYWLLLPLLPVAALAWRGGLAALLLTPLLLAAALAPTPAAALDDPLRAALDDGRAWRRLQAGDAAGAAAGFGDARWRAVAHYRAGRFDAAAAILAQLDDGDAHYNRGNALARQGRLGEALAAYDAALARRPADADARYNRELVARLLRQQNRGGPGAAAGPPPPAGAGAAAVGKLEAARLAEQWLGGVADEPAKLLRRKLAIEHQRRRAGEASVPW